MPVPICMVQGRFNAYFNTESIIDFWVCNIIFHADKTFYSPCPNLEGIKDALCKCTGLVRTVELCVQTVGPCAQNGGHENAFCASARRKAPSASSRNIDNIDSETGIGNLSRDQYTAIHSM